MGPTVSVIIQFIQQTFSLSPTLLLGSTGEIITEKSGNLNLGTPGIMAMGAISSIVGAFLYTRSGAPFNAALGILITMLFGIVGSFLTTLIYCFLTITLKTNQNVTGLALTTFGVGLSNFIGGIVNKNMGGTGIAAFPEFGDAYGKTLPFVGKTEGVFGIIINIFFSYGFLAYLSIVIAIVVSLIIVRTRVGMNLRAVGENPATADAAGINVNKYKYIATCIGGVISGLGGVYFVMDFVNANWQNNILDQFGWLAVALVIFAIWKPTSAILGSIAFSGLYIIGTTLINLKLINSNTQVLIGILPYLVTVIVLVVISTRKKRENLPPASLGLSYFREER